MTANVLSAQLFHGTSEAIKEGDRIKPTITHAYRTGEKFDAPRAFATDSLEDAREYAADRSKKAGTLFGPVYAVHPTGDQEKNLDMHPGLDKEKHPAIHHFRSKEGFKVGKVVSWASPEEYGIR